MQHLRLLLIGLVALVALFAAPVSVAQAATFTVNSTGDAVDANPGNGTCATAGAVCTLRAAIEEANHANNPGLDTITFSIGTGVQTISPGSALPTISDPVIINGYTQPGASANTNGPALGSNAVLKIELDGAGAGPATVSGFFITAGSSTVRGLAIHSFSGPGVRSQTNGGNTIEGNFIGTGVTGTVNLGNSTEGVNMSTSNNVIGGTIPAARNVISGNDGFGVVVGGSGNEVIGNFIGTDVTGTVDLGNGGGVRSVGANNIIGGTTPAARNVISGNDGSGVDITFSTAMNNLVQGNFIGTQLDGTSPLANGQDGVRLGNGANNNTIGGIASGAGNTIAYNSAFYGVHVTGASTTGNEIRGNSIHSNSGAGIQNDSGGNTELSPPTVTGGPIAGTACANCEIDVFSDDADEGRIYHGSVTADGSGNWSFLGPVSGPNVTATATDASDNTSEYSAPVVCAAADGDADGVDDPCDNCPNWPNAAQALPPWTVPAGDPDCDGFPSSVGVPGKGAETDIGTDPDIHCAADNIAGNEGLPDAWPFDFNDNQRADLSDVLGYIPVFNSFSPIAPYDPRWDLDASGGITLGDVLSYIPVFNLTC